MRFIDEFSSLHPKEMRRLWSHFLRRRARAKRAGAVELQENFKDSSVAGDPVSTRLEAGSLSW
jgi:hypothetical protein